MDAQTLFDTIQEKQGNGSLCEFDLIRLQGMVPKINRINQLKKEKNAIILAHSYVSPEIIYGVGDFKGDSYGLSKQAMSTDADVIIFAAVKFMAETAKILNPQKQVYVPAELNGCSLADSISGKVVERLKEEYPDYSFFCYINTTADVKAHCDVCVTSSNVYDIVEKHPSDKIYFLPDYLMGKNVISEMKRRGVDKDIQVYDGTCYVHEQYEADQIDGHRHRTPNLSVLAHPECKPEVIQKSDFVGSTSEMMKYVKNTDKSDFLMLTECGLTSRLQMEMPEKKFVGTCTMCKYMKANTLDNILQVLEAPESHQEIHMDESLRLKAKTCIDAMFQYAEK